MVIKIKAKAKAMNITPAERRRKNAERGGFSCPFPGCENKTVFCEVKVMRRHYRDKHRDECHWTDEQRGASKNPAHGIPKMGPPRGKANKKKKTETAAAPAGAAVLQGRLRGAAVHGAIVRDNILSKIQRCDCRENDNHILKNFHDSFRPPK